MKKIIRYAGLLFSGSCLVLGTIAYPSDDISFDKISRNIAIEKDGTFVQINETLMSLKTSAGARGAAQVPIPYSDSLQALEIIEAYTLKPDGSRVDVKPESIFTQAAPVAVSAPMFNDIKYRIIAFPEPMVGGKLAFKVKLIQKTPFFPGHISFIEALPTTFAQQNTEFSMSAPSDFKLNVDTRGFEGGKIYTREGRIFWKWTFKNPTPRKPEPYELVETDFGPYIAVSSFENWATLSKAYLARADSEGTVSDDVQRLAEEITKGVKDKREEVRAIHEWVAKNIRYVGVFLGLGGYIPRTTAQILETKYGDCKDHTTISVALLRARGIEASTALIQTMNAFQLPKVPVMGVFNHAITYVPAFDLYLDATNKFHSWNVLPTANAGKPTLLTGLGKLGATPTGTAALEMSTSRVKVVLWPDGKFTGRSSITSGGNYEAALRARLTSFEGGGTEKWIANWIRRAGPKAKASLVTTDPHDLRVPLKLSVDFEVEEAVSIDSPGAFRIPTGLVEFPISGLATTADQLGKRTTPFVCDTDTTLEEVEITLPETVKVQTLPKPVLFEGPTSRFESNYRQVGNVIFVTRKAIRNRPKEWCSPDMWEESESLSSAISRDARGQVLLQ